MPHRYRFAQFELLPAQRQLLGDGRPVALGARAFDLLLALVERHERLVTKRELLAAVWPDTVVEEANLPVHVFALRKLLGPQAIATIPGRGYQFVLPLHGADTGAAPQAALADAVAARGRPSGAMPTAMPTVLSPAMPTSLPGSLRPLVGRAADVAALDELLAQRSLVTLVGPGGVGKSLLAQWLLYRRREAFEHGVAWVDLSALDDASRVVGCICAALGLNLSRADPLEALLGALQPLKLLVAIDNAEHVAAEVARVVRAVHEQAPGVRLLVTSQVPLKLSAEQVYRLSPLAIPEAGDGMAEALRRGALALFVERARAADARFELSPANLAAAVEICRRLDGLPLALELAAARVPLFGLSRLSGLLESRLDALNAGRSELPARQQTLRAAMQWSHSLLSDAERAVFRRLGVFAGSFSLDLAQLVLSDEHLDRWAMVDALGVLVEHSLVAVEGLDLPRYRLLETPRSFALECLDAEGETQALRARHATAYAELFEQACAEGLISNRTVDEWRTAWLPDVDNARSACEWALLHDAQIAVSLASSLAAVLGSELVQERGRALTATRALLSDHLPLRLRAQWHLEAAFDLAAAQPALARGYAKASVAQFRALGDRLGLYRALSLQLYCVPVQPDETQEAEMSELIALEDPQWPAGVRAQGANAAACWYSSSGDFDSALHWRQRTLELYQQAGSTWRGLVAHANLMDSLLAAGRIDEAIACGMQLQARLHGTRQLAALPAARLNLAAAYLSKDDVAAARALAHDGLPQALRLGWQPYWADYLALMAALEHRPRAAACLLGFADAAYAAIDCSREVNEARAVERAAALCLARISAAIFDELKREGARLNNEAFAGLALGRDDLR